MKRAPKNPAASLMILWAVGWAISSVARLIDGPRLAVYSSGEVPFGALQYIETIAGLLIAIGVGWAGVRWGRYSRKVGAIGALGAFALHRALLSLHGGIDAWLRVGIASGALQDAFCAAALAWFIHRIASSPARDDRRVPCVVDLAILILVGRDALTLLAPPVSFGSFDELPQLLMSSPVAVAMGIIGMLLGMAVCALALARIAGARTIGQATSIMLGASMFYAFMSLGTDIGMNPGFNAGIATRLSLYVVAVMYLIERGILLSAVDDGKRDAT